jgi:hypothetical protein
MMIRRFPYSLSLLLVVSMLVSVWWLHAHLACQHPVGNSLAALWAFILAPMLLLYIHESVRGE